jgi:peroxiredoxin
MPVDWLKHTHVLALLLLGALVVSSAAVGLQVGSPAPGFTLSGLDGNAVKYPSQPPHPAVIVFWASWCPHCRVEMPVLQDVYAHVRNEGVSFIGVSYDRDRTSAASFVNSHGIAFPIAWGGDDSGAMVSDAYGITGLPTTFVIDAKGIVRFVHVGEIGADTVTHDLANLGSG